MPIGSRQNKLSLCLCSTAAKLFSRKRRSSWIKRMISCFKNGLKHLKNWECCPCRNAASCPENSLNIYKCGIFIESSFWDKMLKVALIRQWLPLLWQRDGLLAINPLIVIFCCCSVVSLEFDISCDWHYQDLKMFLQLLWNTLSVFQGCRLPLSLSPWKKKLASSWPNSALCTVFAELSNEEDIIYHPTIDRLVTHICFPKYSHKCNFWLS